MTALAVAVLAVWAAGVVIIAALIPGALREHPFAQVAFSIDPARICLAVALIVVFWPSAVIAAGLSWLVNRGQR